MHAQSSKRVFGCINGGQRIVHPQIPKSNLTIATARDELAETATLHMDIGDPLLVLTPDFHHRRGGLESLVENTDGSVAESSHKDVTSNLI